MSHDTAGTDSDVVADGHTGQDHRPSADPNTIADFYRSRLRTAKSKLTLFPRQSKPFSKIRRMERRVNLNRRVNECVITDFYAVVVKKNAVHIDFTVISEKDVISVIDIKQRGNPNIFAATAKQLSQHGLLRFQIAGRKCVVLFDQVFSQMPTLQQLGSPQSYNSPAGIFSRSIISFSPIRCFYFTPAGEKSIKKRSRGSAGKQDEVYF